MRYNSILTANSNRKNVQRYLKYKDIWQFSVHSHLWFIPRLRLQMWLWFFSIWWIGNQMTMAKMGAQRILEPNGNKLRHYNSRHSCLCLSSPMKPTWSLFPDHDIQNENGKSQFKSSGISFDSKASTPLLIRICKPSGTGTPISIMYENSPSICRKNGIYDTWL